MRREKKKRLLKHTVGLALFAFTLYFVFNVYTGLTYAIELTGDQSGITVDQSELFNISNIYPGQPAVVSKQPLKIKNTGTGNLSCVISSELSSGDTKLYDILKLEILDREGAALYSGSLGGLKDFSLGTIKPGEFNSKTYNLTLELPADVDNSYQALSTSFVFNIAATGGSGNDDDSDDDDSDENTEDTERLDGDDRTETAIKISMEGWPNGAEAVILARDDDFPDALAGVPLSRKVDAPILLTNKKVLSPATETEIERLGAKRVYILGGTGAVSQGIQDTLANKGLEVIRIGGVDRFETAALIARQLPLQGKAVLTYGYDFPDTLAISPWAATNSVPILLTQNNYLSPVTATALKDLDIQETIVIGGTSVISEKITDNLPGMVRYGGSNRYHTNIEILENLVGGSYSLCLATGRNFPDALVGAAFAVKTNSNILLVDRTLANPQVVKFLTKHKGSIRIPYVFGGEGAVNEQVMEKIRSLK